MAAVLRSPMAGLTDEELAVLRLEDGSVPFHEAVLELAEGLYEEDGQKEISDSEADSEADQKQGRNADEKTENHIEITAHRKLLKFYKKYKQLRQLVPDTPIHELIRDHPARDRIRSLCGGNAGRKQKNGEFKHAFGKSRSYEKTSYKGLFHFVRYIDELQKYDVDFGEADMVGENEDVVRIMSIHKSKGLEFPIVIVSGMGKNFNKQDTRSKWCFTRNLVLVLTTWTEKSVSNHRLSQRRRLQSRSIWKISERNFVCLYVALTRAKEKLNSHRDIKGCPGKTRIFQGSRRIFRKQQTDRFPTLQEKGLPVIWTGYFRQCFPMGTNTRSGSWKRQSLS